MSDENKVPDANARMIRVDMVRMKQRGSKLMSMIKRFIVLILIGTAAAGGFFIGARMHELGYIGDNLKGATITVNGVCLEDGAPRTLGDDQVKVSSVDHSKFFGIIRKTRETVECDFNKVSIEKLPLLSQIGKSPVAFPDIKEMEHKSVDMPTYKQLENKVLLVSGSCRNQLDQTKELAPFTDEKIDVTSVEAAKDTPGMFLISGIRRSDKVALVCSSKAIKYSLSDGSEPALPDAPPKVPVTFINKRLVVTSKCIPDPRITPAPRGPDGRKISFFRLVNSPVQILEEKLDSNDKLVKFTGSIVDKKIPDAFGQMVVCDASTFPMTYGPMDEDDTTLDRVDSQKNNKDGVTGSKIMTEEDPAQDLKKKSVKAPAKVAPKASAPEAKVAAPVAPAPEAEKAAPALLEQAPAQSPEQSKEDLLKQLDGGNENGK